jgi:hypothetical protein
MSFPAMLYKLGSEIVWDGRNLATRIVQDAEEFAEAIGLGWVQASDVAVLDIPADPEPEVAPAKARKAD